MLHSLESGQSNFNIAQRDSMNPYRRLLSVALSFPFLTDLQPARCSATGGNANDERNDLCTKTPYLFLFQHHDTEGS